MQPYKFALGRALVSAALSFAMLLANGAHAALATLSTPQWDMTYDTTQLTDAGWAVERAFGGVEWGVLIHIANGASPTPTFGTANLSFNFKTQRGPLISQQFELVPGFEVVTTSTPAGTLFMPFTSSFPPANAQLTTSYGRETITVLAEGMEQSSLTRLLLGSLPIQNGLVLAGPSSEGWASAPLSPNGSWNLVLTHEVIGSNHLVPSLDQGCVNVFCMPAERSAVQLNHLVITIPSHSDVVAVVPEPETYALMLSGFAMIGWISRRRLRKPGVLISAARPANCRAC